MSSIVLSRWHNPDASAHSNYAHSYVLRQDQKELYHVDLNMELGFFELSEFVSPEGRNNFMIEQASQTGKVKVRVFDKDTGSPLAVLCNNILKDNEESPVFEFHHLHGLSESILCDIDEDSTPDDYAAINGKNDVAALFVHLPKPSASHAGFFSRVSRWAKNKGDAPKDVMEVQLRHANACSIPVFCALAVIIEARGGLQLPTEWQDATVRNQVAYSSHPPS